MASNQGGRLEAPAATATNVPKAVDSLPYAETDALPEGWEDRAQALVQEEMKRMRAGPEDYLHKVQGIAHINYEVLPLSKEYMERVEKSQERPETVIPDLEARLEPPRGEDEADPEAWERVVEEAKKQLEHQMARAVNLELQVELAESAWRSHNASRAAAVKRQEEALAKEKESLDRLNQERRVEQEGAGQQLAMLERKWALAASRVRELEGVCSSFRQQTPLTQDGSS